VHSILDFSNGASVATLDVLQGLTTLGFECQAFCTSKLDIHKEVNFEKIIGDLREPYQVRPSVCGADRARVLYTRRHQVPITFMHLETTRHIKQSREEIRTVLQFFLRFLEIYRPDVMLTYGGDGITLGMIALAKRRGIPVVFALHNFDYVHVQPFSQVDYCIVPSQFARRHYRDKVGLDCQALPNPVDWDRVRAEDRDPRFVTFINPSLNKGVYPFVRIAQELGRRRLDIPLLVVESRGTKENLAACGLDPSARLNIRIMSNTTDPRRFWSVTKIALLPSLWWENQPLVAIEAMINGIPVIGSNRGGIPETLGDGGVLLPLPERLTPVSLILPTAEEVEPWVETIIRLWDDAALYQEQSAKARKQAQLWHPDRLRPLYAEFFRKVHLQPGPPVVPKEVGRNVPDSARRLLEVRPARSLAAAALGVLAFRYFERDHGSESPWRLVDEKLHYQAADEFPSFDVAGFDVILLDEVPKRVADPEPWLSRLRGLLAPGGGFKMTKGEEIHHTFLNHGKHGKHGKNESREDLEAIH